MYLNYVSHYIPEGRVQNSHFKEVNGLEDQWIFDRTGIRSRSKASDEETTNSMAVDAVKALAEKVPYSLEEVDLIVGASYSPYDTVHTMAHAVQNAFNIDNAKALYVSSACSSMVNALEIVEGYIATGKCKRAIVVASEHNWSYSDDSCEKSGHLWGDGAVAMLVGAEPEGDCPGEFTQIYTRGLGHIGKASESVMLYPKSTGLRMPDGRDVFINAVKYMKIAIDEVVESAGIEYGDIDYVIAHQANMRIITNLQKQMKLEDSQVLTNIEELGNTGCASAGICLSQHMDQIKQGSLVALTVFGGGYSAGSALIQF